MKFIDFHTHIYPNAIAERATSSVGDFYGISPKCLGTAAELKKRKKEAGIAKCVLLPVGIDPEHVRSINAFTSNAVRENEDDFIGFGTLHPDLPDIESEICFIEREGLLGIKLHPDSQGFKADERKMFEIYDALRGRLPVLFHCGDRRFDNSSPDRIKKIVRNFPDLTVIAAHLGGWSIYEEAFKTLKNENCFFDLSSSVRFFDKKIALGFLRGYGAERILFGSDFPVWLPSEEKEFFMRLGLSDAECEQIAYKNAERILNISE